MKPGRNDPCPCGSGKKYKRCCLEAEGTARGVGDVSTTSTRTPTGTEAVRSGREIVEQMNREAPNRGLRLTAYQVARIAEPDDHPDPETRKLLAAHKARNWTFAKLATMETGAIEDQLRAFGVNYTRERYLEQSVGKQLAWTISEEWLRQDPVICKGKDEDFLGLAACELWKRLIPERPSIEMVDEWMQEGYQSMERDFARACDLWWKVWRELLPRFTPAMRTMHDAEAIFPGEQCLFNWCQDFEMTLIDASTDPKYAQLGCTYLREWLAQFAAEEADMQSNFRSSLAECLMQVGETGEGERVLLENVERWPRQASGYVALADAYSHFFRGASNLPLDVPTAIRWLEKGLTRVGKKDRDRSILEERLKELRSKEAT